MALLSMIRFSPTRLAVTLLAGALALPGASAEDPRPDTVPGYPGIELFEMPAFAARRNALLALIATGQATRAEAPLAALIGAHPDIADLQAMLAVVHVQAGRNDDALAALERAVALGFPGARALAATPEFKRLADTPRFRALLALPVPKPRPAQPKPPASVKPADLAAVVSAANTEWAPPLNSLLSHFRFPKALSRRPVVRTDAFEGRFAEAAQLLTHWVARGKAAGNRGDLYDNRDDGHSILRPDFFPQLARTVYAKEARAAGIHYGLNNAILFDAPSFGNSSTALTGSPVWRSQARAALTAPDGPARLSLQYATNQLYVFPEHRDHDPAASEGFGDVFPANTPYLLVSQGSSGSDLPLLRAVAMILAALRPDTKAALIEKRLIAPAVQWAFRHGIRDGGEAVDYLDPRAHPSAFRAEDLDPVAMIRHAQGLTPGTIPPLLRLSVLDESPTAPEALAGFEGANERLFDSPSAIARAWRSAAAVRQMTVSAAQSVDPGGKPLDFTWKVLRGDAERIRIEPLDDHAAAVRLTIPWHERRPVPGRPELTTDRVDIAVFARNGVRYSAPGFVSVLFPADQIRRYETGPDGEARLAEIDYADPERRRRYTDPLIFPKRDWRDVYHYDDAGRFLGLTRTRGKETAEFTRHGARVIETDPLGRPRRAEVVAHRLQRDQKGAPLVVPAPTGEILTYVYASPEDRLGRIAARSAPGRD